MPNIYFEHIDIYFPLFNSIFILIIHWKFHPILKKEKKTIIICQNISYQTGNFQTIFSTTKIEIALSLNLGNFLYYHCIFNIS